MVTGAPTVSEHAAPVVFDLSVIQEDLRMSIPFERGEETPCQCPVCNAMMASEPLPSTSHDARCAACGYPLWCRKRMVDDVVVLQVIPGRAP